MRVVHVITGLGQGGAEAALVRLLAEHRSVGFSSRVISFLDKGYYTPIIRDLGIRVDELGEYRPLKALQLVNHFDPDVVQLWTYYPLSLSPFIRRARAVIWSIRCSLQSLPTEKPHQKLAIYGSALLARLPKAIVYNSRQGQLDHETKLLYPKATGTVIPNGFDTTHFFPKRDRRELGRRALGIANDEIVVGNLARFHPVKNQELLLQAARMTLDMGLKFRLVFGGAGAHFENSSFAELVKKYELKDRCLALGPQDDTPAFFDLCDIFVSSSIGEGFPNVIGEAMAMELPIVATDVGDTRRLVGGIGGVVPSNNAVALAKELSSLLRRPLRSRLAIGRAGRARIEESFTSRAVGASYADLYHRLCG